MKDLSKLGQTGDKEEAQDYHKRLETHFGRMSQYDRQHLQALAQVVTSSMQRSGMLQKSHHKTAYTLAWFGAVAFHFFKLHGLHTENTCSCKRFH